MTCPSPDFLAILAGASLVFAAGFVAGVVATFRIDRTFYLRGGKR